MKTLSLTAAFAFLFFSAANANDLKQAPAKATQTTTQKAPATHAKSTGTHASKAHATKKPATAKPKPQTAKASGLKPTAEKKGTPVTKPTVAHSSNFTREHSSKNIMSSDGHKKHHKGGKKPAAKPAK